MTSTTIPRRAVWMKLHPEGQRRLRGALMLRGKSHRQFAEEIGWKSHGMVGQLLKGTRTSVSPESAVVISKVLGIPVHDLFLTEVSTTGCQVTAARKSA